MYFDVTLMCCQCTEKHDWENTNNQHFKCLSQLNHKTKCIILTLTQDRPFLRCFLGQYLVSTELPLQLWTR